VEQSATVVKDNPAAPFGFYEAEAAGLRWLARAHGVRTARIVAQEPGRIELERVIEVEPDAAAAHRFGTDLARTHAAGASAFGARPKGYHGLLYIGEREMPAAEEESWGAFYARDRVLPFLQAAVWAGNVDADCERDVREACDLIASGRFDDDEPPARLHGDLWRGNVLFSADGAVLIDPAAHGGHRETDLAMLELFGFPFLDEVIAGYEEAAPLAAGRRERIPLHQLHPLAVHAAGHGHAYGAALHDAALATLALA